MRRWLEQRRFRDGCQAAARAPSHVAPPVDNPEKARFGHPRLHKRVTWAACAPRGSGAARPLRGLRRRGQQRTQRPPQAAVFDPPTVVFGFAHPDRAKRFRHGQAVRRQRLDHLQPLDDLPRAELRPHHHRHPRTALHAASERPPAAVKGITMRFVGYPQIGRRINLRTSKSRPSKRARECRARRR